MILQLTWVTKALVDTQLQVSKKLEYDGKERSVSYLPLAHISAMVFLLKIIFCKSPHILQIADMYLPILIRSTVSFAQPDDLKVKYR